MTDVAFGVVSFKLFSKLTSSAISCQIQKFKLAEPGSYLIVWWLTGKVIARRKQRSSGEHAGNLFYGFTWQTHWSCCYMIGSPAPFNKKRLKLRLKWARNCSRMQWQGTITDVSFQHSLFIHDWKTIWERLQMVSVLCSCRVWFFLSLKV